MKYTSLLSICSVLALTTISFSQETVMTGMGSNSSGFRGVEADVPAEEQKNDCPDNSNDEVKPNDAHHDEGNEEIPVVSSDDKEESPPAENNEQVVPSQNIFVFDINKSWLSLSNPAKSWIYTARTNEQIDYTPRTKLVNTKSQRKRFVLRGNCPNGTSTSQRPDQRPSFDNQDTLPLSYACDCCCHLSNGNSIQLTTSSNELDDIYDGSSPNGDCNGSSGKYGNQSKDRYDSSGRDDQNGYEDVPCSRGNDDRQSIRRGKKNDRNKIGSSCDNKDGQYKSYYEWSDDECKCTCNCKRFGEVVIYD